jgi:plasmid stability protein
MLRRLRASRLDNSHDAEVRNLLRVDLLIVDNLPCSPSTRPTPQMCMS